MFNLQRYSSLKVFKHQYTLKIYILIHFYKSLDEGGTTSRFFIVMDGTLNANYGPVNQTRVLSSGDTIGL